MKEYTIAIIGGGPAGLAAAVEASKYCSRVALITQEKLGGRALWHSLTPSKVWLHAAGQNQANDILAQLQHVKSWQFDKYTQQINKAGVDVFAGAAQFSDKNVLTVHMENGDDINIKAKKIIIATGSVPFFPDGLKPDGKRIIAPRLLGSLETLPKSIVIVGGGVTGSEMAYLFNRMGAKVTLVTDMESLLPRAESDISQALESILQNRGVVFHKNVKATLAENQGDSVHVRLQDGRKLSADYAFVAIGRKADVSSLQLEKAGIAFSGAIAVDDYCRTTVPSIYAAGDVTGAPMTANRAIGMAKIAARNALTDEPESLNEQWIVEAIYTEPQVAHVGDISGQFDTYRADFSHNLKAHITKEDDGFVKIFTTKDQVIVGASAIGPHAADLIFSLAVAVRARMTVQEFQQVVPANPTLSEVFAENFVHY